jgi:hypothetical protein
MDWNVLPALQQAQLTRRISQLNKSNDVSRRYGLSLSDAQIRALITAEEETLRACGRLEFGDGILPRLIDTFCDSPYINRDGYTDVLATLQELFYTYKNELDGALTDDELLEAMYRLFHGRAQGSIEYLENIATETLHKVLRSDGEDEDEDDG